MRKHPPASGSHCSNVGTTPTQPPPLACKTDLESPHEATHSALPLVAASSRVVPASPTAPAPPRISESREEKACRERRRSQGRRGRGEGGKPHVGESQVPREGEGGVVAEDPPHVVHGELRGLGAAVAVCHWAGWGWGRKNQLARGEGRQGVSGDITHMYIWASKCFFLRR